MLMPKTTYVFALLMLLIAHGVSASDLLALKESVWLSSNITPSDKLFSLTNKPTECLNPDAPAIATLGRLAFESPALLGGQASRISLSCASCHPSGRTNPHFFIKDISSIPGSADITHSFFSSTGGNNTLTAVTIPDLARLDQSKIKNRQSIEFRNKLRQLIEVEFDGQRPPTIIIDALQTYLAHTDTKYCQTTQDQSRTINMSDDWLRLLEAVNALAYYTDKDINKLLIRIARKRLENIYLRYNNLSNQSIEQGLIKLSRQLAELSLDSIKHKKQITQLPQWHQNANALFTQLLKHEVASTYDLVTLTRLINHQQ